MNQSDTVRTSSFRLIFISLMTMYTVAGIFYILHGRLFLDAGFYLNACREVFNGNIPYRDFFFVQGPVYPYIYGAFLKLTGPSVLAARSLSLCFGIITVALAAWTAHRLANRTAAIITLLALTTVPFQAYFFISIKLYALTALFLTATCAVFASQLPDKLRHSLGMILIVLAASTRLTLVPLAFVAAIYVIVDNRKKSGKIPWIALAVSTLTAASIAGPFLIADHEAMLYNLIGIHTSATSGPFLFHFSKQLKVLAKILIFYPVLTLGSLFIFFHILTRRSFKNIERLDWFMLISLVTATLVHLTANWFSMGYQSPIMPLAAIVIGVITSRYMNMEKLPRALVLPIFICIAASWLLSWQKPVWSHEVTITRSLKFTEEVIKKFVPENATIAGCSGLFALETQHPHALAFGGSPFTYTPGWTTSNCHRFGGMNNEMIIEEIQNQTIGGVLLEKNSFSVGFPGFYTVDQKTQDDIYQALDKNYQKAARVRSLGSGELELILYIPKGNVP